MTSSYVQVCEKDNEDPVELPTESDGTLLLSTLTAQFPGATGLKYLNPDTGAFRAVRLNANQRLLPPEDGWSSRRFLANFPRVMAIPTVGVTNGGKRRAPSGTHQELNTKVRRGENPKFGTNSDEDSASRCTDLICLGLSWDTTEEDLQSYFSKFGDLLMTQIKRDNSGKSRGYGFVRYADLEGQCRALNERHMIDGRWVDCKIPNSKGGVSNDDSSSKKIFIGRVTPELTEDVLREQFGRFGTVTEVFVPKPFRAFAFVTFQESKVAQCLIGQDMMVKGVSVRVGSAAPKQRGRGDFCNDDSACVAGGNPIPGAFNVPLSSGPAVGWNGGPAVHNVGTSGMMGGFRHDHNAGWDAAPPPPPPPSNVVDMGGNPNMGNQQNNMINALSNLLNNPSVLNVLAQMGGAAGAGVGQRMNSGVGGVQDGGFRKMGAPSDALQPSSNYGYGPGGAGFGGGTYGNPNSNGGSW